LLGCEQAQPPAGFERLSVWAHAGQAAEREILEQQVQRFNAQQGDLRVDLTFIPERTYNAQVQAAAIAGELPDLLELDGPYLPNYAWQGHLTPLDALLSPATRDDLLPSIIAQGTYRDGLYGVGTFDSGLALYARRSALEQAGIRVPRNPGEAWTKNEFSQLLLALRETDEDGAVLDLKLNYPDEWFTYAFSPVIQSAGGDLIGRDDYQSARDVLNGQAAVSAMNALQDWIQQGLVDPNLDDAAFASGRVALSWAGHWEYRRYHDAVGDELALVPLPDFGEGTRTGQGSWVWSITRNCGNPEAAARFIEFLLQPEEILVMTEANGAVPATRSAIALSPLYREEGPLHLFVVQLAEGHAVPRPQTPAYPVISSAFRRAFADIRNGAPVRETLDDAAALIDQDIRDNRGYAPAGNP
jgi:multiple sugar transport system substrate-binding protein